ncbi:MAG: diacylglycerol kinase family protein [Patescibacteria group bacterium]|jgi:hypothetical protein
MNVFIYDDFIKKHAKTVNNVEILLHKLNLNGKIVYLESVRNINDLIKDEVTNGSKTIIAVGNDKTVNKVLNGIINGENNNVALGIIPIGDNNSIAHACGVKNEREACDVILARRLEKIDVAYANKLYFVANARIKSKGTTIKIDDFSINQADNGEINVINLLTEKCSTQNILINPQDSRLNLLIDNKSKKFSLLTIKELLLENNLAEKILIDESIELETPIKVGVSNHKINLIVGKNRNFNII